jgi:hypothetical protein
MDIVADIINSVIAIFTAIAAIAAWFTAVKAAQAAKESSAIAEKQTEALMTAAKANALATRIDFYDRQMAPLIEQIQKFGARGGDISAQLGDLAKQQKPLVYWLDKQTDALQVGLRFECPGSEYNSEVQRWRGEQNG